LEFVLSSLFTASDEQYDSIPDDEIAQLARKFWAFHKFHKERRRSPRGCFEFSDTTHFTADCPKKKKLDSSNKQGQSYVAGCGCGRTHELWNFPYCSAIIACVSTPSAPANKYNYNNNRNDSSNKSDDEKKYCFGDKKKKKFQKIRSRACAALSDFDFSSDDSSNSEEDEKVKRK
jgi:hypothetical protein